MIAAWMLHSALVAAIVAIAALAIEHGTRRLRSSTRFVWLGALVVAAALSAVGFVSSAEPRPDPSLRRDAAGRLPETARQPLEVRWPANSEGFTPSVFGFDTVVVPRWLSVFDRSLIVFWFAGSTLWGAILVGSAVRLRRLRANWPPAVVDGAPVYVSHDIGPALFGIVRHSIVVPMWVLDLDPEQRRLIIIHEREHARAGDPVTLLFGALLVLLQPWNPAIWLMFQRLRFAVEADCDRRVLAHASDVRSYGELLLSVGEHMLAGAAPVAALTEPHSHLDRRISLMTQLPIAQPLLRSMAAILIGAVLTAAAYQVPRPVAEASPDVTGSERMGLTSPPIQVPSTDAAQPGRVMVRLTSVGLENGGATPTILVFANGPARVGLNNETARELTDTLRLNSLPAMTLDVTDSDVHLQLVGPGRLRVGGEVIGGPATRLSAAGPHIILKKGGVGVLVPGGRPREVAR